MIVSLAVTLLLLGLVEFVSGFFVESVHPQEIPGDAVSRTVTWLELNPAPLVRDVDLLWRNKPDARKTQLVNPMAFGRQDRWTVENNSEGFRGPELDRLTAEVSFRILCVGDSITFGFSVDQEDTYPHQLSTLLKQRYPRAPIEVVNAGVPGWSWVQGLRFLDLRGKSINPDLIVMGHGTNDQLFLSKITDDERFARLSNPFQKVFQKLAILAAETNTYRVFARGLPKKPEDVESPGCQKQIRESGGCRRVSVEQIALAVGEASDVAAHLGAEFLVVNTDFVQTAAIEGVREGVERNRIPFLDLVEEVSRRREVDEARRASRLGLEPASDIAAGNVEPLDSGSDAKQVVLRTLVPDSTRSYRASGTGYFRPHYSFDASLYDDGTHGDERPADGVFTTTIEVPRSVPAIAYKFYQGELAEFAPVPPLSSTLGDRVLQVPGSVVGPVDVFGRSLFMVERAHPDQDGHEVIAEVIANKLEEFPSFRDFIDATSGGLPATSPAPDPHKG